ncbi:MAG: glycosyltransferase family 2 protein [Burkholderiales bacterium]
MSIASSGAGPSAEVSVSVVVPCYEARATIRRALESVFSQTVRPFEVIAVDDASTDGTPELLEELRSELPEGWLRIVRSTVNRGPSAARNEGWEAARGEFVAFLDADDSWMPRKIEVQHHVMAENPGVALSAHLHAFNRDSAVARQASGCRDISFQDLLWRNRFVTPSVMIRRDIPLRFRPEQRHMEDHLLWMQLAHAGHRIVQIDQVLAVLHKPSFGASGLSANLFAMERAELRNYLWLWRNGCINAAAMSALTAWSVAKFTRRLGIVAGRKLAG